MEGTLMIKSYRGLLADGTQDLIRLKSPDGMTGYRVVKFQLFPAFIGSTTTGSEYESLVQIHPIFPMPHYWGQLLIFQK